MYNIKTTTVTVNWGILVQKESGDSAYNAWMCQMTGFIKLKHTDVYLYPAATLKPFG